MSQVALFDWPVRHRPSLVAVGTSGRVVLSCCGRRVEAQTGAGALWWLPQHSRDN